MPLALTYNHKDYFDRNTESNDYFTNKDLSMKFVGKKRTIPIPLAGSYNREEKDQRRSTSHYGIL